MSRSRRLVVAVTVCGVLGPASTAALGWATTDILSNDDAANVKLAEWLGWPAGTAALVNDDSRVIGWHFFFSECPNDVYEYGFRCETAADVNRLIGLLAKIEATGMRVILSPQPDAQAPLTGPKQPRFKVAFAIGCQKLVDEWFSHLPFDKNEAEDWPNSLDLQQGLEGRRRWGIHLFEEPPAAMPPTLRIYLGSGAFELSDLKIPADIEVLDGTSRHYRETHSEDAIVSEIDAFLNQRKR